MPSNPPTRRRLTAEQAKSRILEAAARQLAEVGPEGLKLTALATELGISHPAILHHFGSREGLVGEVVHRAAMGLQERLAAMITSSEGDPVVILETVADFLGQQGHGRTMAWLALSRRTGAAPGDNAEDRVVEHLAKLIHGRSGQSEASRLEEVTFRLQTAIYALMGEAIMGQAIRWSSGQSDDPKVAVEFRRRLALLLATGE